MAADAKRYWRNPAVSATAVASDLSLVEPEGQDVYYLDAVTSRICLLSGRRYQQNLAASGNAA